MTGMETMLKTLLKAMGFEPQAFIESLQGFIKKTLTSLQSFDAQLKDLNWKLDKALDHLEYIKPSGPRASCEVDESMAPILIPADVSVELPPEQRAA